MGDYRHQARNALNRAKAELDSGDHERLKYAALELRMSMECLTYDRALAYKAEFPPQEYETWQPRKVMAVLLEIDPRTDKDSSLAFGIEPSPGERPEVMHSLGSEKVLNMPTLKRHYDAIGSYLHVQSMKQHRAGATLDFARFRTRCDEIAAFLTGVLASRVWNSTMGNFSILNCGKCGKPIRKRIPHGVQSVEATCFECGVTYTLTATPDGRISWEPDQVELRCANSECATAIYPWRSEVVADVGWTCEVCGGGNVVRLGIAYEPKAEAAPASRSLARSC